jgi:hypothetical protein
MAAGNQITVFRPKIYVADVGTVLPGMDVALGGAWPAGRKLVPYTEEGAVISPSAPKDDINADEVGGSIAVVPAGGSEINISFTTLTPDLDLFSWLSSFNKTTVAAVVGPPAFPEYSKLSLTPEGRQFMIGIEGELDENSLVAEGGFVRAFGYKVEQTEEVEINMRRTGEESALRLAANVRCLTTTVESAQLTATGISNPDSRFNMLVVENTP